MTTDNKQGIEIPDYLDTKFFQNTLENGLREIGIVPHQISFDMGCNAGDNFCSRIYRVKINFKRHDSSNLEDISVIVKSIPITRPSQFLADVGVFMKEISLYCDVIPRLEVMLDNVKFSGRLLYAQKEPIQTIVFDDLKAFGYTNTKRQAGLDFSHCKIVLEKLGQFHGTSMVLAKKDPSIRERLTVGGLSKAVACHSDTFVRVYGSLLSKLAQVTSTWPGYEKIGEKLTKYHANLKTNAAAFTRPKQGNITVLNHADMWITNFMFAYDKLDSKRPIDVVFVDFQMSYFGSPACDINFFLNACLQYDVLVNQRADLIDIYYKSLTRTLEALDYPDIPTMKDLNSELRIHEGWGLFAVYGALPVRFVSEYLSGGNYIDVVFTKEENEKRMEYIFANEEMFKHFKYMLKRFDELGVLDELNE